jgi:hypothetical protein
MADYPYHLAVSESPAGAIVKVTIAVISKGFPIWKTMTPLGGFGGRQLGNFRDTCCGPPFGLPAIRKLMKASSEETLGQHRECRLAESDSPTLDAKLGLRRRQT